MLSATRKVQNTTDKKGVVLHKKDRTRQRQGEKKARKNAKNNPKKSKQEKADGRKERKDCMHLL